VLPTHDPAGRHDRDAWSVRRDVAAQRARYRSFRCRRSTPERDDQRERGDASDSNDSSYAVHEKVLDGM
jgi:hypothetical protein